MALSLEMPHRLQGNESQLLYLKMTLKHVRSASCIPFLARVQVVFVIGRDSCLYGPISMKVFNIPYCSFTVNRAVQAPTRKFQARSREHYPLPPINQ